MKKCTFAVIIMLVLMSFRPAQTMNCTDVPVAAPSGYDFSTPEGFFSYMIASGAGLTVVKGVWTVGGYVLPPAWKKTKQLFHSLTHSCKKCCGCVAPMDDYHEFLESHLHDSPARGIVTNFFELLDQAYQKHHHENKKFKKMFDQTNDEITFKTPIARVDFSLLYSDDEDLPSKAVKSGGSIVSNLKDLRTQMQLSFGATDEVNNILDDILGFLRNGALHLDLRMLVSKEGHQFPRFYVYIPLVNIPQATQATAERDIEAGTQEESPLYMLIKTALKQPKSVSAEELTYSEIGKGQGQSTSNSQFHPTPWSGPVTLTGTFKLAPENVKKTKLRKRNTKSKSAILKSPSIIIHAEDEDLKPSDRSDDHPISKTGALNELSEAESFDRAPPQEELPPSRSILRTRSDTNLPISETDEEL